MRHLLRITSLLVDCLDKQLYSRAIKDHKKVLGFQTQTEMTRLLIGTDILSYNEQRELIDCSLDNFSAKK